MMTRRLTMLLLLGAAACAASSRPAGPPTAIASTTVQAEIEETLARAAKAYSEGDYEAVLSNYLQTEDVTMVIYAPGVEPSADGQLNHVVRGISAIRKFYTDAPMFKPDFDRPKMSYRGVTVSELGAGLVNTVAWIAMEGGDPRVPRTAVTSMVMYKDGDRWRILHDHTQ